MIDYSCPECGIKLLEASGKLGVRVEIKCRCGRVVEPVHQPHLALYECSECGRAVVMQRPRRHRDYCVACGRTTLRLTGTVEADVPTRQGAAHGA